MYVESKKLTFNSFDSPTGSSDERQDRKGKIYANTQEDE